AIEGDNIEPCASVSTAAYACPNVSAKDRQVRLNIPWTSSMRAPGEAQGNFALESAMDELSYALGLDPLELRLRNYAEVHPRSGLPWSSKALRACYEVGADRFGWARRDPDPGSMREGDWLVGYGLAGVSYFWYQAPCRARVTVRRDGTAYVRSAVTDIGTGTYTVMTQLSAELLGLEPGRVTFGLGDTGMPPGPQAGGSGLTAALGNAVHRGLPEPPGRLPRPGGRRPGLTAGRLPARRRHRHRRPDPPGRRTLAGRLLHRHPGRARPRRAERGRRQRAAPGGGVGHGARGAVRRAVRGGPGGSRAGAAPRGTGRVGDRRRADPQREAGRQPDHRRHGRRDRHGAVRGDGHRPGHR